MAERLQCLVPFCRRTTKPGRFNEWICGKHWPLVSRRTKARRRKADRILDLASRRFEAAYAAQGCCYTHQQYDRWLAKQRLAIKLWERCKSEAIERAMGITA